MNERESGKGRKKCKYCGNCECHPDLSWMKLSDSPNVFPSDVDGLFVTDRLSSIGKCLFIEWKEYRDPWGDEPLTKGQDILLQNLSMLDCFTVLHVHGINRGTPYEYQVVKNRKYSEWIKTDKVAFTKLLNDWNQKASIEDNAIAIGACISNAPASL